jgi:hypothetical protein
MKAECGHRSDAAKRTFAMAGKQGLRCVLDHHHSCPSGNFEDRVHVAGHASVVNWDDRPGPRGDRSGYQLRIDIERARIDIDEDRSRAAQNKRVRRGGKSKRGHDHFIARPYVRENGRHLERGGT